MLRKHGLNQLLLQHALKKPKNISCSFHETKKTLVAYLFSITVHVQYTTDLFATNNDCTGQCTGLPGLKRSPQILLVTVVEWHF